MDDLDADSDGDTPLPFIEVKVGDERTNLHAFIDTELTGTQFQCLSGMTLSPTHAHFKDYLVHLTPTLCLGTLKLFFDELTYGDKFFVTQPKVQDIPLTLTRT